MSARAGDPQPEVWDRWVRRVLDTRTNEDLGPLAYAPGDGTLVSWHVTDKPDVLLEFLRRRGNVVAAYGERGRWNELGPGLYLGSPRFWSGRATRKWDFLRHLSDASMRRLLDHLVAIVHDQRARGHITESESARAFRTIDQTPRSYGIDDLVGVLANQPYNIAFWRPAFLHPLGIAGSPPPAAIAVVLRGKFAELNGTHPPRRCFDSSGAPASRASSRRLGLRRTARSSSGIPARSCPHDLRRTSSHEHVRLSPPRYHAGCRSGRALHAQPSVSTRARWDGRTRRPVGRRRDPDRSSRLPDLRGGQPCSHRTRRAYASLSTPLPAGIASYRGRSALRRSGQAYVQDGNHRVLAAILRGDCVARMLIPMAEYQTLVRDALSRSR